MVIRKSYRLMAREYHSQVHDTLAEAMGMSFDAFDNRVLGKKDQDFRVRQALQMQELSKTTHFAEAVASVSGGVFVALPDTEDCDREELLKKFNQLHAEIGNLSQRFLEYTEDDEICEKEKHSLNLIASKIHKDLQELLRLSFSVYCNDKE